MKGPVRQSADQCITAQRRLRKAARAHVAHPTPDTLKALNGAGDRYEQAWRRLWGDAADFACTVDRALMRAGSEWLTERASHIRADADQIDRDEVTK